MATTKNCFINLISLLLGVGLCSSLATAIDSIRAGEQLNSSYRLVSAGETFTLGFFSLQDSDKIYLGIWYSNDDPANNIWVANPNKPFSNNSVTLIINTNGELTITSNGGNSLVLNSDKGSGKVNATLQDSGNLVVNDETEQRVLWESFDHPTNTLLPGMKLGFNLKTGQNWTLTSWLTSKVPASGAFTMSWDPTQDSGGQLVIRRRGEIYWTSGALQNESYFEYMPMLNIPFSAYRYTLSYVSNEDEKYFTFSVTNEVNIKRWTLEETGQIVEGGSHLFLTPYGEFCYGYESNSESGCASAELPKCRGRNDKLEKRSASFVDQPSTDENSSLGFSDCWAKCWNDCDCVGYTIASSNGTGCTMWRGNLKFRQDYSGATVPIYVLISQTKGNWWKWIIIAIVISLIFLLLGFLCYLRKRKVNLEGDEIKREKAYLLELTTSDQFNNANEVENDENEGRELKIFSFAYIMEATNNFSTENKLGQGGFGPVFKGKLHEGREIAIKRLSKTSGQGLVEFRTELRLIAKLQHTNLVRILGCCIQEEEKMLIYEYMPNKSLDYYLFDPTKRKILDWKKRFNIIEGIAQGLLYLHKYSRLRVIHRDLKASNILLDGNMNPKISDFGLARIFGQNESERNTNRIVGTYGYMSPEYAMEGNFSVKSDVFSFGVLILEIVSGKKNTSFYHLDRPLNLIGYTWELWKEGTALELMDPTLGDSCPAQQLLRIIQLGLLCVQESATDRPTMSDVTGMLSNETMPLLVPQQPAFFTGRSSVVEVNSNEGKDCSVNNASITTMQGRT